MRALPRFPLFLALLAVCAHCGAETPAPEPPCDQQDAARGLTAEAAVSAAAVNDRALNDAIVKAAETLIKDGKTAKMAGLIEQLKQSGCCAKLAKPGRQERSMSEVYAQARPSVLVVSGIYKCDKCSHWHASNASGYVISESGVAVTNYHVVNKPKNEALVAATAAGQIVPVKAVLAASEADDIAILQLDGQGFQPLALAAAVPVGARVCAISHPDGQFYTLKEGIVSRYFVTGGRKKEVPKMAVTADFARGSSGGPILDAHGNVAGMVGSTTSIYYNIEKGQKDNLQMVLKHCVPAASILRLIEPQD